MPKRGNAYKATARRGKSKGTPKAGDMRDSMPRPKMPKMKMPR